MQPLGGEPGIPKNLDLSPWPGMPVTHRTMLWTLPKSPPGPCTPPAQVSGLDLTVMPPVPAFPTGDLWMTSRHTQGGGRAGL